MKMQTTDKKTQMMSIMQKKYEEVKNKLQMQPYNSEDRYYATYSECNWINFKIKR